MTSSCSDTQLDKPIPKNSENPRMKMFLNELRSTNCRKGRPTAVIIPGVTKYILLTTNEALSDMDF